MRDEDVVSRLLGLGEQPVDPGLASQHLSALAVAGSRPPWFRQKLQVAAALVVGLLVGSTGLAAAGALPDTAQQAAHNALGKVGVDVPPGHDRVTEGCGTDEDGKPFKNHGQYVKAHPDDPAAGESDCGKPKKSVNGGDELGEENGRGECPDPQPTSKAKGQANCADKAKANAAKGCKAGGERETEDESAETEGDKAGDDADAAGAGAPPAQTPAPEGTHGSAPGPPDETPANADPIPSTTTTTVVEGGGTGEPAS